MTTHETHSPPLSWPSMMATGCTQQEPCLDRPDILTGSSSQPSRSGRVGSQCISSHCRSNCEHKDDNYYRK